MEEGTKKFVEVIDNVLNKEIERISRIGITKKNKSPNKKAVRTAKNSRRINRKKKKK